MSTQQKIFSLINPNILVPASLLAFFFIFYQTKPNNNKPLHSIKQTPISAVTDQQLSPLEPPDLFLDAFEPSSTSLNTIDNLKRSSETKQTSALSDEVPKNSFMIPPKTTHYITAASQITLANKHTPIYEDSVGDQQLKAGFKALSQQEKKALLMRFSASPAMISTLH